MTEATYVGVKEPALLRKTILLSARDVISSLKNYEVYKDISREKTKTVFELRRVGEELVVLNRKLRQAFPKTKLPQKKAAGKPLEKKTISKLQDLEKALDKIEGKLKGMK